MFSIFHEGMFLVIGVGVENMILEYRQQMQKFKETSKESRFKKYALNLPINSGDQHMHLPKQLLKAHALQIESKEKENKVCFTDANETASVLSIRSSRDPIIRGKLGRKELANRKLTKKLTNQMRRYNTQSKDCSYEEHISTLKHYVNGLMGTCNLMAREQTRRSAEKPKDSSSQSRKKFLMSQISFTEIEEDKINAQKKYLTQFEYLSRSLPKGRIGEEGTAVGEITLDCLRGIDKAFAVMAEMEDLGYSKKNNRYMIDYCGCGRMWLKQVFLYESSEKRDAFTLNAKYYVLQTSEEAKEKFSKVAVDLRPEDLNILHEDIEGICDHLEHALTQKKIMQTVKVADYIEARIREEGREMGKMLRINHSKQEKMNLTFDLNNIEEKFGAMREISKVSRKRFQQLNKTYDRLHVLL